MISPEPCHSERKKREANRFSGAPALHFLWTLGKWKVFHPQKLITLLVLLVPFLYFAQQKKCRKNYPRFGANGASTYLSGRPVKCSMKLLMRGSLDRGTIPRIFLFVVPCNDLTLGWLNDQKKFPLTPRIRSLIVPFWWLLKGRSLIWSERTISKV